MSDTDFYSFSVLNPSKLGAVLTPRGGVFTQGSADDGETPTTFDANARNNLAISIFASNGTTLLSTVNLGAAGVAETIANLLLPAAGTYFARVSGGDDTVQLYQLGLTPTQVLFGDYNNNGIVDAADYSVWRNSQGQNVTLGAGADGNFDGQVTAADFDVWRSNFGKTLSSGSGTGSLFADSNVPEPGTFCLTTLGIALAFTASARRGSH
ncbi:MAG: dockerin type I domain-containing protein [Burkholderiales bacterium]